MKIKEIKGYKEFKKYCNFELCEKNYPGWVGEEKYIIVSDVSEQDLLSRFPEMMNALSPYVMIPKYYNSLNESMRHNDEKHACHTECSIDNYESLELLPGSLCVADFSDKFCAFDSLESALLDLSEIQRSRVIRRFYLGMSIKDIAEQDGVKSPCVINSIELARKKLKKILS